MGVYWLAQAVLFNHSNYFSHSTTVADWGFPHGGRRAFSQPGNTYWRSNGSNWGPGNYGEWRGGYNTGNGYNTGYGQGFSRGPQTFAGSRPIEGLNRAYEYAGVGYARPVPQAYNHMQAAINTARPYARPGDGSSFSEGGRFYTGADSTAMGRGSSSTAGELSESPVASGLLVRLGAPDGGKAFSGYKPPKSGGGFHLFGGGGHSPKALAVAKASAAGTPAGGGGHSSGKHHR